LPTTPLGADAADGAGPRVDPPGTGVDDDDQF
jgi:hypothetical protein